MLKSEDKTDSRANQKCRKLSENTYEKIQGQRLRLNQHLSLFILVTLDKREFTPSGLCKAVYKFLKRFLFPSIYSEVSIL